MLVVISSPVVIACFAYLPVIVFPSHPECPFTQIRETDSPFACSVSSFCMLSIDNVVLVFGGCFGSLHLRNFVSRYNVSKTILVEFQLCKLKKIVQV